MKNKVELIGIYGSDITHSLSAWTSTSRDLTPEKKARIGKLLNMLGTENHHTPFEKSGLHFLVTSDIASHIHILKHRIGVSVNGESARYKELKDDKFYVPVDWDQEEIEKHTTFCEHAIKEYHECLERLVKKGFSKKRAKESARLKLPYSNQIVCDVMFNFRSFMHFQNLRNSSHAQLEIREIAQEMLKLVQESGQFPLSLKAFGYYVDPEEDKKIIETLVETENDDTTGVMVFNLVRKMLEQTETRCSTFLSQVIQNVNSFNNPQILVNFLMATFAARKSLGVAHSNLVVAIENRLNQLIGVDRTKEILKYHR